MDFTREPIIETIITPKEGCKLVVRSSKNTGQEEYSVDALEIVSYAHTLFYRSLDRPKAFLAPISDFEVVEVREARMVLKNAGLDRAIKIGGGRETPSKNMREQEKVEESITEDNKNQKDLTTQPNADTTEESAAADTRVDKKRDRRRNYRKKRGREDKDEAAKDESIDGQVVPSDSDCVEADPALFCEKKEAEFVTPQTFSALLQPPPRLISDTINLYRQNDLFKDAFYLKEDEHYQPHDKVDDLLNEDVKGYKESQHNASPESISESSESVNENAHETLQPVQSNPDHSYISNHDMDHVADNDDDSFPIDFIDVVRDTSTVINDPLHVQEQLIGLMDARSTNDEEINLVEDTQPVEMHEISHASVTLSPEHPHLDNESSEHSDDDHFKTVHVIDVPTEETALPLFAEEEEPSSDEGILPEESITHVEMDEKKQEKIEESIDPVSMHENHEKNKEDSHY